MGQFTQFIDKRRFEILLVSLLLLLFGPGFVPIEMRNGLRSMLLILNVVIGAALFFEYKRWRTVVAVLAAIIASFEIAQYAVKANIGVITGLLYMIYFFALSIKVYQKIYKAPKVGPELISAVFCGFIMLTMMAFFVFLMLEISVPGSFEGIGKGIEKYQNLQYFSFITTLTIGYGDMTPVTYEARQLTVLMGLAGNFYSVIVTGIVIGKYLQKD